MAGTGDGTHHVIVVCVPPRRPSWFVAMDDDPLARDTAEPGATWFTETLHDGFRTSIHQASFALPRSILDIVEGARSDA
jgi:hypothetical protein